jgi:hypothetical protein
MFSSNVLLSIEVTIWRLGKLVFTFTVAFCKMNIQLSMYRESFIDYIDFVINTLPNTNHLY